MNILEMAMAAKMAGGNGGTGPIDPKRLPEGYPYKEGVTIEWDGNTEGLVAFEHPTYKEMYYKVSNNVYDVAALDYASLRGCFNGETFVMTPEVSVNDALAGLVELRYEGVTWAVCVSDTVAAIASIETGLYFHKSVASGMYTESLSCTTIHPMAPEFLPAGVGGGAPQKVTFTMERDGTSYNFTCSHTGAEIAEMAAKGPVLADIQGMNVTAVLAGFMNGMAMFTFAICQADSATIQVISVNQNDGTGTNAAIQS